MTLVHATVKKISSAGLDIEFPDGKVGRVPLDQIFPTEPSPVVLENLVYHYPSSIVIGDSIPVLPMPGDSGTYSRKEAVLESARSVAGRSETIGVTVSEVTSEEILGISDLGFEVYLPYASTVGVLVNEFGRRRLSLERETEDQWLYIRDRIQVQVGAASSSAMLPARILVRGGSTQEPAQPVSHVEPREGVLLPSRYSDVLIIGDNLEEIERLDRCLQQNNHSTHWMMNLKDLEDWRDRHERALLESSVEEGEALAIVKGDAINFAWPEMCQFLCANLPSVDTVLTYRSESALNSEVLYGIREQQDKFRILGVWTEDSGVHALNAVVSRQSALSQVIRRNEEHGPALSSLPPGDQQHADVLVRYRSFHNDCKIALDTLLHAAGTAANPCAALLFQIHRKSHLVSIVAATGDQQITARFEQYVEHLHKSPIRDLALHDQDSDTEDAKAQQGRYRYFLRPMGGLDANVSVMGLKPASPQGSPFSYAAFLVSRSKAAFQHASGLTRGLKQSVRRSIELALVANSLDDRVRLMQRTAERAFDFQFMAHEAEISFLRPYLVMQKTPRGGVLDGTELESLRSGIERSRAVMTQLLPGKAIEWDEFEPVRVITDLLQVCRECELADILEDGEPPIRLVLETSLPKHTRVEGRRLAFECVLRNLILNGVQQILEYCKAVGEVRVTLRGEPLPTGALRLHATVSDDGPGIHRKDWDAIFVPGMTNRSKGTGLGLAVSRRLITDAGGTLDLEESFIYRGTRFRVMMPVQLVGNKKPRKTPS